MKLIDFSSEWIYVNDYFSFLFTFEINVSYVPFDTAKIL